MRIHPRASAGLRAFAVVAGLSMLGAGLAATPAAAAKPAGSSGSNCVVALAKGGGQSADMVCFATFTEAIRHATNGAVTNAAASAATADPTLAGKLSAASTIGVRNAPAQSSIIGIEYDLASYGGWSLTFTGSTVCTGPVTNIDYAYSLPQFIGGISVWDAISSFRTFFSPTLCFEDHYYLQNFGLPRTGFYSSQANMPSMNIGGGPYNGNNNTRSITWS